MIQRILLALAAALLCVAAPADPTITELEAEQRAPTPHSDRDDPLAFHLDIRARCASPDDALQVAASLGDTITTWHTPRPDDDAPTLVLAVPSSQLVLSAATLCQRRGDGVPGDVELSQAFSAQVVARCTSTDGAVAERSTSTPVAVRFACESEPPEDAALEAP